MKYIKLFEDFDVDRFSNSVESTLIELDDAGFKHKLTIYDALIDLNIVKKDRSDFVYSDIKDYVLTIIDYYKDTVAEVSYSFSTVDKSWSNDNFTQMPCLIEHKSEPEYNRIMNLFECYILIKKDEGAGDQ